MAKPKIQHLDPPEPQHPQAFNPPPPESDMRPTQRTPDEHPLAAAGASPNPNPNQTLAQEPPTVLTIVLYPGSSTPPHFTASKPVSYSAAAEALLKIVKDLMFGCEREAAQSKMELAKAQAELVERLR